MAEPKTHYPDGTPRDWVTMELRAEDYRTLQQLAQTWQCSRENALGILCRAVRMQVWPLGDVLTNHPEFQSWVERVVFAEQAPLREAFRRATPEEEAAMLEALPHGRRTRGYEPVRMGQPSSGHRPCQECGGPLQQFDAGICAGCLARLREEDNA